MTACAFQTKPMRTYESHSHSTIAKMHQDSVKLMMLEFPDLKDLIKKKVIDNPYDTERTYFVNKCKQNINYLKDAQDEILKALYY